MNDINYKNHELLLMSDFYGNKRYYQCSKCLVNLYTYYSEDNKSFWQPANNIIIPDGVLFIFYLSCEEYIIKNIIE